MADEKLSALADYAARTWQREFWSINLIFRELPAVIQTATTAEQCREDGVRCRTRASEIRAAVRARNFILTFDLMAAENSFGVPHFRVLERAFPLMTQSERACSLQYVWCRSKLRVSPTRALRLFRAESSLHETVPVD